MIENYILYISAVGCVLLFCIKPTRQWIGRPENYNAAIALIAFFGVIVALPIFSKQINNIQISVDSLQQSIKGIYSQYIVETFCYDQLKNSFTQDKTLGNVVNITLKEKPIPFTVNLWEGALNVDPTEYRIPITPSHYQLTIQRIV